MSNSLTDGAMKSRFLAPIPDLETQSEATHTWTIDDWRSLPRKARGPIFECGGHPWYVRPRQDNTGRALGWEVNQALTVF